MMETFYKITNPDGTAFHDGQTKYELGKTVRKRNCSNPILCTDTVLHASRTLIGALKYAKLPLAIWKVEGDPVVSDLEDKCGFFALTVVKQIDPSDELLGFRYHEACHPVNPMLIQNDVADADIADLKSWASVWASVRDSVWASAGAYIGSLFLKHEEGVYPFRSAVDLWRRGFVPLKIEEKWHLYGWRDGRAVSLYEGEEF